LHAVKTDDSDDGPPRLPDVKPYQQDVGKALKTDMPSLGHDELKQEAEHRDTQLR
jgi:hypothetical protein